MPKGFFLEHLCTWLVGALCCTASPNSALVLHALYTHKLSSLTQQVFTELGLFQAVARSWECDSKGKQTGSLPTWRQQAWSRFWLGMGQAPDKLSLNPT